MFYTYVLKSEKNSSLYIGFSADLKKRLKNHNDGSVDSTKHQRPWKLIYYESFLNREQAQNRETKLKQRGRAWQELKRRILI